MEDERYLHLLYRAVFGKRLRLNPPVTYNEKIQWLKLHDKNPAYPELVDKIAVRKFVCERAGERYLIPLLGVWDDPDDIDFSALPERFVLKCSHDSGSTILCPDKTVFHTEAARRALKKKLRTDYSAAGREWPYADVPRRILAEAYIGEEDGTPPIDYKFFCFSGKAMLVLVCTNRENKYHDNYVFSLDFEYMPVYGRKPEAPAVSSVAKPPHFDELIALAEKLSAGFRHMRVDLYDTADGVRFGEITLHSSSGLSITLQEFGDRLLGEYLELNG